MWGKALEFEDTFAVGEREIITGTALDESTIPAELPERAATPAQQLTKLFGSSLENATKNQNVKPADPAEMSVEEFFDCSKAEVVVDVSKRSSRGMIRCEKRMVDGLEWIFQYDHLGRCIRSYPPILAA
jgi:hypothetical protein